MLRKRVNFPAVIMFAMLVIVIIALCLLCFAEYKLRPIVSEGAVSRARIMCTGIINSAVSEAMENCGELVRISTGSDGIAGVETDIVALARLRSEAVNVLMRELYAGDAASISVPLGNLTGSSIMAGRGIPINIKLVPIGDAEANIRTEFIESGINQTLHRIVMKIRITVNVLVSDKPIRLDLASDVNLAETVIVGKVPDAYTAINRYEIDEDEENDLNDYAATLP